MVFMYIGNCLGGRAPNLDIDEIGNIVETAIDGTLPEKVMNLNRNREVLKAIPSLEFDVDLRTHAFSEIEQEIESNRPVIAWVELADARGLRKTVHAIVITGLNRERHLIYYNDPMFGEREEDIGVFMSGWENVDRILVKIKIGQKEQRILDEYVQKENNSKEQSLEVGVVERH